MKPWPLYVNENNMYWRTEWERLALTLERRLHVFSVPGHIHAMPHETLRQHLRGLADEARDRELISQDSYGRIRRYTNHRIMISSAA